MKARVIVDLNERTQKPSVNANVSKFYKPNDIIEIIDIVNGDEYEGNSIWYQLENKAYVWSGGVQGITSIGGLELNDDVSYPWQIQNYGIHKIWSKSKGEGVRIGILDTGIQLDHPNLKHAIKDYWNFVDDNKDVDDWHGHGTHCAGVMVAKGLDDVFGVCPKAELYVGKIMDTISSGINESVLLKALDWMIKNEVHIISLSGGKPEDLDAIKSKILEITEHHNITVVAAIGNGGEGTTGDFPAKYEECISVGAIDIPENLWAKTSRYDDLTICAPGKDIKSTWIGSSFKFLSGTSMATPYVAGIVAILKSTTPKLNSKDLKKTLIDTSKQGDYTGFKFNIIRPKSIFK